MKPSTIRPYLHRMGKIPTAIHPFEKQLNTKLTASGDLNRSKLAIDLARKILSQPIDLYHFLLSRLRN